MEQKIEKFEINNICLHYLIKGEGDPVLLIPGSISDYRTWTYQIEELSKNFKVIAISRRYQFPSSYVDKGNSDVVQNTNDIVALLKYLNIDQVNIVGHSYGGYIAINIASKYPQIVKNLVLEEPIFTPVLITNPNNPVQLLKLMIKNPRAGLSLGKIGVKGMNPAIKALAKKDYETAKNKFIFEMFCGTKMPSDLDKLTKIQLDDNIASFAGENFFNPNLSLGELSKISAPTLLINGDLSPICFNHINRLLSENIEQSQQLTITKSSHWVHIDQKDKFNSTVLEFLMK